MKKEGDSRVVVGSLSAAVIILLALISYLVYFSGFEVFSTSVKNCKLAKNNSENATAQEKLNSILGDKDLIRTFQDKQIKEIQDNLLVIDMGEGLPFTGEITKETRYEKIRISKADGQTIGIVNGARADLKVNLTVDTMKANPLKEIEYVSYKVLE